MQTQSTDLIIAQPMTLLIAEAINTSHPQVMPFPNIYITPDNVAPSDPVIQGLVEALNQLHEHNGKYQTKLIAGLAKVLGVASMYFDGVDIITKVENTNVLKAKLLENTIRVHKTTGHLNMLMMLAFGADSKVASGYAHIVSVALSQKQTDESFAKWVKDNVGLDSIRKNFNRDGSAKDKIVPPKKPEVKVAVASLPFTIGESHFIFEAALPDKLKTLTVSTEYTAIIVRHPDGRLEIKIDGDGDGDGDLDGDLDKANQKAMIAFRKDMNDLPSEMVEYQRLLKIADLANNLVEGGKRAETCYRNADEYRMQIIGAYPHYDMYFDKSGNDLDATADGVARLRKSQSMHNISPL